MKKILFVVLDGLGDLGIAEFNGKTPLEEAKTPNMDYLAENGITGLVKPYMFFGESYPTSEGAHIGMFGYKDFFLGRGPYEVAGIDMPLYEGDVALRVNFATIDDNGVIIDRRAGRIEDTHELIEALKSITIDGISFDIKASVSHRAGLILRGSGLSPEISTNDPHKEGLAPLKVMAESPEGRFTAEVLNKYIEKVHEILNKLDFNKKRELKANYILVRGAGQFKKIYPFEDKYGLTAACVAGGGLYKGIGKMLGMHVIRVDGATGKADTDLWNKFNEAEIALEKNDFVFMHIKATDVFSHDGDYQGKKNFIEEVDRYFNRFIERDDLLIVITADHSTPCFLKEHSKDPVPILIFGNGKDDVRHFNENEVQKGQLGLFESKELMNKLLKIHEQS
jgi:2,3-bisphosphoglycerate-independent phosphoglycerate mutase